MQLARSSKTQIIVTVYFYQHFAPFLWISTREASRLMLKCANVHLQKFGENYSLELASCQLLLSVQRHSSHSFTPDWDVFWERRRL